MSTDEDEHLLAQAATTAVAIGRMFPGLCEVVLHDLRDPGNAIRVIENNLSGRAVGDSATELGLRRIADPAYPDVVQNYPNRFPDGRPVKSTSIGIRNRAGRYIAALCLNLDLSSLSPMALTLTALVSTAVEDQGEDLRPHSLRATVEAFAAERASSPRALSRERKRELVRLLHRDGWFASRSSAETIADLLGVSRATVYNYAKSAD
ncbi:helix-turn-helix transcriptional regulator [Pseudonocardia sp. CA-107938]|uniref:helix-turn-helix transcriptional regulator n=1 Tax=Pseudonocardia sp. CA-107938 TaxID=3240021 RepID=UPI003D908D09